MKRVINIGKQKVGVDQPCYIIAEMSANHNQSIERAEAIVREAAASGANAVKLQTYTADTLTIPCDNEFFRIRGGLWEGYTLHQLYQEAYTPWEWQPRLKTLAHELGMECFSTPFDASSVDFLEKMDVVCYKVASFEIVDVPLLKKIASTGKPVIMSTGMATLSEIDDAVKALREGGTQDIALLKCTSAYPAPAEEANVRTIPYLSQVFDCPAGISDHTKGSAVAVTAVAVGASVVEKHFTLSRSDGGPDSDFSLEPAEFKQMVSDIRMAEASLGKVTFDITAKQKGNVMFRRSLFAVRDIKAGEVLTEKNVRSIRPGHGLAPKNIDQVLGRKAIKDISAGTPISWDII
jgi:pseudaminic acid synthase